MVIGLEHLTSNVYTAFPFKENCLGLAYGNDAPVHGGTATVPLDFLIDAAISLPSTITELYLNSITRLNATTFRFIFTNQYAATAFTYDLIVPVVTEVYSIIDMQSSGIFIYVRFLVSNTFFTYLNSISIGSTDSFQQRLPFECTVLSWKGPKVEGFTVEPLYSGITDIVKFINGYNTELVIKSITDDYINIIMNIAPGIGAGLYPCVPAGTEIKPPLNLIPDSEGGVKVVGDDCYTIIPHLSTGQIEIQGGCASCCDCEEYRNVGVAIKKLIDRANAVKNNFLELQTKLNDAITTYNEKTVAAGMQFVFVGAAGSEGSAYDASLVLTGVNLSSQEAVITECELVLPSGVTIHTETTPSGTIPSQHNYAKYWHLKCIEPIAGKIITVDVNYQIGGVVQPTHVASVTL